MLVLATPPGAPAPPPLPRSLPNFLQQGGSAFFTLVICLSSFALTYGTLDGTLSYFRDNEVSNDNMLAAGSLAFRLNPGEVTIPIKEGDTVNLSPLFEPKPDSFDIRYRIRAEIVGSDSPLCTLLQAAGTSSPYVYNGTLKDLVTEPATTTGHGHLDVTLPNAAGLANGTECTIALAYNGWYAGAPEGTGYTDEQRDTFTFVFNAEGQDPIPSTETSQALMIVEESATSTPEVETESSTTTEEELLPTPEESPTETPAPPAEENPTSEETPLDEEVQPSPPAEESPSPTEELPPAETPTTETPPAELIPAPAPESPPPPPTDTTPAAETQATEPPISDPISIQAE
jgi:hypothetical protein